MVTTCYFTNNKLKRCYDITYLSDASSVEISLQKKSNTALPFIEFYIEFNQPIISWRNHDYSWVDTNEERIANDHSPKLLVLKDGSYAVSHKNIGLWHFEIQNDNTLKWVLKHPDLEPVFQYDNKGKRRFADTFKPEDYALKLLFSKNAVPEFSRSKIPFSPIVCFTDHCDFDTEDQLQKQLTFFKEHHIKITKGFFLNSFSKRSDNANFSEHSDTLLQFKQDGHELAYHTLTQSIREKEDALSEFREFEPPFDAIVTWIDHGYQPYNLTLLKEEDKTSWSKTMASKNVKNLWTYVDSGTSGKHIINQINPKHFTSKSALAGIPSLKGRLKFFFRTFLFFSGDEDLLRTYRNISFQIKEIRQKKRFNLLFALFANGFKVLLPIMRTLLSSNLKNKPFKYSRFSPLIFKHTMNDVVFNMFQTVEVTDFVNTFSKTNIDLLVNEKGVIICHNYFSSNLAHQKGRLFNGLEVADKNIINFEYLGNLIKEQHIWNPSISELIEQYNDTQTISYALDESNENIIIKDKPKHTPIRFIEYADLSMDK